MQPITTTNETLIDYYTTAINALAEIAHTYFFLGKLEEALHILNIALQILPADTATQKSRLKLLLLRGRVLIVDHLLHRRETDLMFSTLLQA
ncbi:MAG TPA: hypothetical protein VFN35_04515, partial [Ktedonobacteraceae bacterium]|nr:hypothetical protein [Ktedonobacteraceae bacterium]